MLILLKTGMYPEIFWYMSWLYITNNEIDKAGHCTDLYRSQRSKQHVKGLAASIVLKHDYVCHYVFLL